MHTMKKFIYTLASAALTLAACSDYGDIEKRLDSLESRVQALETVVSTLNGNIQALQAFADGGRSISNVVYDEATGVYTLTLSDGTQIVLTQGAAGDAVAPVMSIDGDGCWTVDYQDGNGPQFVLQNGEKVRATGDAGKTPVMGVDSQGYWTVKYSESETPQRVLDAEGNPVSALPSGASSSDSFFAGVECSGGLMTLTLKDGSTYTLPVVTDFICAITGASDDTVSFVYGEEKTFTVEMKNVYSATIVAPSDWTAWLDYDNSVLTVKAPDAATKVSADSREDVSVIAVSTSGFAAISKIRVSVSDTPAEPAITDYYQAYCDGKDITVCGVTYNKETSGEATLLSAETADTDLRSSIHQKSGIFFLDAADGASFSTSLICEIKDKVILIGRYVGTKVTIKPAMCWKLMAGELSMKNIIYDMSSINGGNNALYAFNNANSTADLDRFNVEDCDFINVQKPLLYFSKAATAFTDFCMTDSSIQLTVDNVNLFNFYKTTVLDVFKTITFDNNIVYNASCGRIQLFNYDQNTAQTGTEWNCAVSICNNTFYNVPSANGYLKFWQLASLKMNRNIFWADPSWSTSGSYMVIIYSDSQSADGLDATDNIAYGMASGKNWAIAHSNSKWIPSVNQVSKLDTTPFETADAATGTFTPTEAYSGYGAQR